MQLLVSALFDRWFGKPILVIGGGPSVSADLPRLHDDGIKPACVISANDHGFKQEIFPVDIVVNLDRQHCMLKVAMRDLLRPLAKKHGAKIVNPHGWADYRMADWTLAGNSGFAAVGLAAALGGAPVIVTGIDMFQGGHIYFHSTTAQRRERRKIHVSTTKRNREALRPLKEFTKGAPIRPMSGPLQTVFPPYDPNETPTNHGTDYRARLLAMKPVYVEAVRSFTLNSNDPVRLGDRLAFSPKEARDSKIVCNTVPIAHAADLV